MDISRVLALGRICEEKLRPGFEPGRLEVQLARQARRSHVELVELESGAIEIEPLPSVCSTGMLPAG